LSLFDVGNDDGVIFVFVFDFAVDDGSSSGGGPEKGIPQNDEP
jgi:hypothetical protein